MLIANLPIRAALFWLLFIQCGFSQTARVQPAQQRSAGSTEQVRLSEILISTPQPYDAVQVDAARHRAEQVRSSIGRSGTFADVARANSQGPTAKQGGDLGCFTHGKLPPDLEDLVFRMRVGDVSEVVRTKQGFVILEVNERGADPCADLSLLNHGITADLKPYLETLKQNVLQRWYKAIPRSARSEMKRGSVTVEFSVQRDGTVTDQKVTSGSGDIDLDNAALNAVSTSGPFLPLPSSIRDHLRMHLTFQYNPPKITDQ
jgi:TonB family protein